MDTLACQRLHAYIVDMPRIGLLGTFEQMVLLAILQVGEGAYPPLILEQLEVALKRRVSRGSLYITLDRLQHKGMLRSKAGTRDPERGGHPKRYVSVTKKGIAALRDCRESLATLWAGLDATVEE
jgi:PadR family transcriptional regulator PadR